jgi:hypothetical protein
MPGVDTYNKIISTVNSVTTDYQFIPDISNIITIDTSNNRIGIGTLNPETSLHIKGSNNLGIITTNLEISSNPYDLNSGFVKSSLIPDNFNYSNSTFTEPTNDNSKNQFTLGDPSNPWYSVYCISGNFQEINLGGNTLYIDGKAVLGKEGNNIKFGYEEENYDIKMSSKFTDISINGNLNFISYNNIPRIITSQSDIIIDPSGIGDNSGKVTIKGDLIVFGNQTALSSQELDISDNIITLNKGYDQALNGTNITSGFYIDKGQSYTNASLLYYIDQDNWKLSGSGGLKIPSGNNNERYHISDPGTIRYNSELTSFEGYNGTAWGTLGGVISVDKRTKIIPETSPNIGNNQLDFYTDNNHIMRLDECGNMLPMHINQNIGNNTKAWKNIYIGDSSGIDYNLNDNSSNAIYLNNIKILYFDNNKNLVFNNPNSNIKIPFNLSVDGTAGIASTANNNTNIAGGFVYNTKIGIDQNGINGLEQSYFSQTQTYELTVLDSINFHDSLTNNYNYSLKDANFNNLEISNNLIVNGDASFNNNLEVSNNLIVKGDVSINRMLNFSALNFGNNTITKMTLAGNEIKKHEDPYTTGSFYKKGKWHNWYHNGNNQSYPASGDFGYGVDTAYNYYTTNIQVYNGYSYGHHRKIPPNNTIGTQSNSTYGSLDTGDEAFCLNTYYHLNTFGGFDKIYANKAWCPWTGFDICNNINNDNDAFLKKVTYGIEVQKSGYYDVIFNTQWDYVDTTWQSDLGFDKMGLVAVLLKNPGTSNQESILTDDIAKSISSLRRDSSTWSYPAPYYSGDIHNSIYLEQGESIGVGYLGFLHDEYRTDYPGNFGYNGNPYYQYSGDRKSLNTIGWYGGDRRQKLYVHNIILNKLEVKFITTYNCIIC